MDIRPSTIPNAGNGVFVTRAYAKDSYLCKYDGVEKKSENDEERKYTLTLENGIRIVGHTRPQVPDGVAQLVNDCACPSLSQVTEWSSETPVATISDFIYRSWKSYTILSKSRCNVWQLGRSYFANRDIEESEELFVTYGYGYWLYGALPTILTDVKKGCLLVWDVWNKQNPHKDWCSRLGSMTVRDFVFKCETEGMAWLYAWSNGCQP